MPEVVLTRVTFIPNRDLDELKMRINDLLKNFERNHKIETYAQVQIIKRE
jgi:selenocysteine-specific translation elongation factor